MLTTMAREVIHELDVLNTKSLANIAWAYGNLPQPYPSHNPNLSPNPNSEG